MIFNIFDSKADLPQLGKWSLLWVALVNLFKPVRHLYFVKPNKISIGMYALSLSAWVKPNGCDKWEQHKVTFDGVTARGYINDVLVSPSFAMMGCGYIIN